jgi:hypothetical protein
LYLTIPKLAAAGAVGKSIEQQSKSRVFAASTADFFLPPRLIILMRLEEYGNRIAVLNSWQDQK